MAREVIDIIKECINLNTSFVLEAGAGAGKTHTLMQTIDYIQSQKNKKSNILCITYTNVAKEEIKKRIGNSNIEVNTLHEFLWGFIKQYQIELKKIVVQIIKSEETTILAKIMKAEEILANPTRRTNIENKTKELEKEQKKLLKYKDYKFNEIRYTGYKQLNKGNLGHDNVIEIALKLFENPSFINIFLNQYTHIFIDEFQDTNLDLLNKILEVVSKKPVEIHLVVGLFGDRMQQIYSNGSLEMDYIELGFVIIEKVDNHRSNEKIIQANNILRNDGFIQECRNHHIPLGKIEFIFNLNNEDRYLKNYILDDYMNYKRLFLTHNEIAREMGFSSISEIFDEKYDYLVNDKLLKLEDRFIAYVNSEIIAMIYKFHQGQYTTLLDNLKKDSFTKKDLEELYDFLNEKISLNNNLQQIIRVLLQKGLMNESKLRGIYKYYEENDNSEFINSLLKIDINEYFSFYEYITKRTNLETMAGVKGEEYENVIVNLRADQRWRKFDFDKLLKDGIGNENSLKNAHKLFYVSCTRAKSSLIINYIVENSTEEEIQIVLRNVYSLFGGNMQTYKYENEMVFFNQKQLV